MEGFQYQTPGSLWVWPSHVSSVQERCCQLPNETLYNCKFMSKTDNIFFFLHYIRSEEEERGKTTHGSPL